MAYHYELRGGSLVRIRYSDVTYVNFSFYVFDLKSKVAAYCWYGQDIADAKKLEDAKLAGKIYRHQTGVGSKITLLSQAKPLDLKKLDQVKYSLSIVNTSGSSGGAATLAPDDAPILQLLFPIVADFGSVPAKSSGSIIQMDTVKTSLPKLPALYHAHEQDG